jgi:hypothetical protein
MATTITAQEINGPYTAESSSAKMTALTLHNADTTGNTVIFPTGKGRIIFFNSGASTRTIAITSSFDDKGRKADIGATNITAGAVMARDFEMPGWEQTLGGKNVELVCNHAEVKIIAISL